MPLTLLAGPLLVVGAFLWVLRLFLIARRQRAPPHKLTIGFFHPYCDVSIKLRADVLPSNDGGGGERVLWRMLAALAEQDKEMKKLELVVYSGDKQTSPSAILDKALNQFGIHIPHDRVKFVFLQHRWLVEASTYPYFTMIGQSVGSMLLGLEALWCYNPHIFFDTMGYAFTFPVFKYLGGSRIACYVHYPTISTDMLAKVSSGDASFNNAAASGSAIRTRLKLVYYNAFAKLYSLMGNRAELIMANSSWTRGHIIDIWKRRDVNLVFPACDTTTLQAFPLQPRENLLVSVAQFRPEKNHPLQLAAFVEFRKRYPKEASDVKFVLIGGTRVDQPKDQAIVDSLNVEIHRLGLEDLVTVKTNIASSELRQWLSKARAGIHTMANEHFGISVVELMAAGVIPVVHDSGGPRKDIVVPWDNVETGYRALDVEGYATALHKIFSSVGTKELDTMQRCARSAVATRFSDETFSSEFIKFFMQLDCIKEVFPNEAHLTSSH